METDSHSVLSGWKEIAHYLGKGVRTVQRYERDLGLPVRRPSGHDLGSVVAIRSELDAWVSVAPMRAAVRSMYKDKSDAAAFRALAKNVEKMKELRAQMKLLRADMRTSLETLHASISCVSEKRMTGREPTLVGLVGLIGFP